MPPMGPPMRPPRHGMQQHIKVPVFKNIAYALKLTYKADKRLFWGYLFDGLSYRVFSLFVQNILFLKILLEVIEGQKSFGEYVKTLFAFLIVSLTLKAINQYSSYVLNVSDKRVLKNLNNMVFEKAISLDVSCYEDPEFYDKYQRATTILLWGYFDAVCQNVTYILGDLLSLICVIWTVSAINPVYLLFLIPVCFVFVVGIFMSKLFYKRDLEMTKNNRIKAYIQRTVFLKDYSKDIRTSNIFAVLMQRFKESIDANIEVFKKYGFKFFCFSIINSFFSELLPMVAIYAYAAFQFVVEKTMTVSGFSVVITSINSVREAALSIANSFRSLSQMAVNFQNFREFMEYEPKVVDGTEVCKEFESLEFKNVSFHYPTSKKNSLSGVSFKIEKGETIALVGMNGAGKSTIVKLLLRFYDVTDGEILLNGKNIKEYTLSSLRNIFGAVFQDYKNFAVSVYENVLCHECDEKEKEKAETALRKSGIWKKISSLEKQGDTVLTREFENDGIGLSGGENQKISVARLFAKDYSFAVLDEPSSALDPIAEAEMYQSLIDVTKNKTVLYISHRLSSAVLSDRIIVLDGGKISEIGTHDELMMHKGEYFKMFSLQASSYNAKKEETV